MVEDIAILPSSSRIFPIKGFAKTKILLRTFVFIFCCICYSTSNPTPFNQCGIQQAKDATVITNNTDTIVYVLACFAGVFVMRDS